MTHKGIEEIKRIIRDSGKKVDTFGVIYHTDSGRIERIV